MIDNAYSSTNPNHEVCVEKSHLRDVLPVNDSFLTDAEITVIISTDANAKCPNLEDLICFKSISEALISAHNLFSFPSLQLLLKTLACCKAIRPVDW